MTRIPAAVEDRSMTLAIVILQITSMGSAVLPIVFAFGLVGCQIASELLAETGAVPAPAVPQAASNRPLGSSPEDSQAQAQR